MAPEIMVDRDGYDGSVADSFSVGVVMLEVCLCPGMASDIATVKHHQASNPPTSSNGNSNGVTPSNANVKSVHSLVGRLASVQDFSCDRKSQGPDFGPRMMAGT